MRIDIDVLNYFKLHENFPDLHRLEYKGTTPSSLELAAIKEIIGIMGNESDVRSHAITIANSAHPEDRFADTLELWPPSFAWLLLRETLVFFGEDLQQSADGDSYYPNRGNASIQMVVTRQIDSEIYYKMVPKSQAK
jgi:hypothetical protein